MLKHHANKLRLLALIIDLSTTVVSFVVAFKLREWIVTRYALGEPVDLRDQWLLCSLIVVLWGEMLAYQYEDVLRRFSSFSRELRIVLNTVALGSLLVLAGTFALKIFVPRSLLLVFVPVNFVFLVTEKYLLRELLQYLVARGYNTKTVLIVGAGRRGRQLAAAINECAEWGLSIIGFIDLKPELVGTKIAGATVLGTPADLREVLHGTHVDTVFFAIGLENIHEIDDMIRQLEVEGIGSHIVSDFFHTRVSRVNFDRVYGIPLMSFDTAPRESWQLGAKRVFDVVVSALLLLVLSPLFVVIAVLIKQHDGGPVFYKWRVVGLNRRPFIGYKFRTMMPDADALKQDLLAANEMTGAAFKMKNDPRITPVGRILRRLSLDELPQLWSVLKGDMSMVGPRPPLQSELNLFDDWQRRKLSVKPGLVCLREVNGRSDIDKFDEWVKLDLEYIDNWSFWMDIKILLKLIPTVLTSRGAY